MKEIDPFLSGEWYQTNRTLKTIMRYTDGTCYTVWHFLAAENEAFSKGKLKELISGITGFLPDSFNRRKIQFYKDYLLMALTTAYYQYAEHQRPDNEIEDIVFDVGLGYDTSFGGVINRALIQDDFLIPIYGTKLATGKAEDLDGYLESIYSYRKSHPSFDTIDTYHPVFAGFGALIDIFEGRKYDSVLDRHITKEYYETIGKNFPEKSSFVKAYGRYLESYFVTGMRDDFQKNVEHAVKSYLISEGLSQYDDEPRKNSVRVLIEKTERRISQYL